MKAHLFDVWYNENWRTYKPLKISTVARDENWAKFDARQRLGYEIVILRVEPAGGVKI
jgi:hypothetical protein